MQWSPEESDQRSFEWQSTDVFQLLCIEEITNGFSIPGSGSWCWKALEAQSLQGIQSWSVLVAISKAGTELRLSWDQLITGMRLPFSGFQDTKWFSPLLTGDTILCHAHPHVLVLCISRISQKHILTLYLSMISQKYSIFQPLGHHQKTSTWPPLTISELKSSRALSGPNPNLQPSWKTFSIPNSPFTVWIPTKARSLKRSPGRWFPEGSQSEHSDIPAPLTCLQDPSMGQSSCWAKSSPEEQELPLQLHPTPGMPQPWGDLLECHHVPIPSFFHTEIHVKPAPAAADHCKGREEGDFYHPKTKQMANSCVRLCGQNGKAQAHLSQTAFPAFPLQAFVSFSLLSHQQIPPGNSGIVLAHNTALSFPRA